MNRILRSAALLSIVGLSMSGCSHKEEGGSSTSATPSSESQADAALVHEKAADWGSVDQLEIPKLTQSTKRYTAQDPVSMEEAASSIMRAMSTPHKNLDTNEAVQQTLNSAPGQLRSYMRGFVKWDKKHEDFWPLGYATDLADGWSVTGSGQSTSGWQVKDVKLRGEPAVEVSLATRSIYPLVRNGESEPALVPMVRWVSLTTVNPEYAATSGDYYYRGLMRASGADVCTAQRGRVAPYVEKSSPSATSTATASSDGSSFLRRFFSAPKGEYIGKSKFRYSKKELADMKKQVAAC